MLPEVRDHVRTNWNDRQLLSPGEIQGCSGEKSGYAVVLVSGRHFRVIEIQPAGFVVVILEEGPAFRKPGFEAVRRNIVLDRNVVHAGQSTSPAAI